MPPLGLRGTSLPSRSSSHAHCPRPSSLTTLHSPRSPDWHGACGPNYPRPTSLTPLHSPRSPDWPGTCGPNYPRLASPTPQPSQLGCPPSPAAQRQRGSRKPMRRPAFVVTLDCRLSSYRWCGMPDITMKQMKPFAIKIIVYTFPVSIIPVYLLCCVASKIHTTVLTHIFNNHSITAIQSKSNGCDFTTHICHDLPAYCILAGQIAQRFDAPFNYRLHTQMGVNGFHNLGNRTGGVKL